MEENKQKNFSLFKLLVVVGVIVVGIIVVLALLNKKNNSDSNINNFVDESKNEDTVVSIPGVTIDGVKYYDASWVKSNSVKYNPGKIASGNSKSVVPGKCTTGDDCKIWYPYSEFVKDGKTYVNMIMDRNTTANVEWISSEHWKTSPNNIGVSYPSGTNFTGDSFGSYGNNKKGPLTVLNQLHLDTDSWNLELRTDSYTPIENSISNYTIDYSGYKARLISAEEIALITRYNTDAEPNKWNLDSLWFYFGTLNAAYNPANSSEKEKQESYSWLFDYTNGCTVFGCTAEDLSTYGYWTSSPNIGDSSDARYVYQYGTLSSYDVNNKQFGLRPVITVLASDIF